MEVTSYQVFEDAKKTTIETFIKCRHLDSTTMNGLVVDNGLKVEQYEEYQWVVAKDIASKTYMIYRFEFVPDDYDKIENLFQAIEQAEADILSTEDSVTKKTNLIEILDTWKPAAQK